MAEPWIRVHAGLIDKPVIDRAVQALGVSEHEAVGLLVTFWGAVSANVIGGYVADRTDRQLENWARWKGKRGRFAAFIRESHVDPDGRVNEWDDYAGALEARRAKERERLRNKRIPLRNGTQDVAQQPERNDDEVRTVLQPARANETERDGKDLQSVSPREEATLEEISDYLTTSEQRHALEHIVRGANSATACLSSLRSMLTGNDTATPQPTAEQFGRAVIDFHANGERWNASHFRGYLKRAGAPPKAANGKREPSGPGERGYRNALAALEGL